MPSARERTPEHNVVCKLQLANMMDEGFVEEDVLRIRVRRGVPGRVAIEESEVERLLMRLSSSLHVCAYAARESRLH
jgi:hypothetical protein